MRTVNYENEVHEEILYDFQQRYINEALENLEKDENKAICSNFNFTTNIKGYSVNSFINLQKENYDNITIAPNIKMKTKTGFSPSLHFFGLFSGHGNGYVSEILKNKLLKYIVHHNMFLIKTHESIIDSHKNIEEELLLENINDKIGSCSLTLIIIDNVCYVSNLGDSRAILSLNDTIYQLTKDHVPSDEGEKQRIIKMKGSVYEYLYN
jgi:serine/threonine protein phosphatase PrpC